MGILKLNRSKNDSQSGQALIIVMLVLTIAAIIATGVASRTVLDTRRTGRERSSTTAFTYAESSIESLRSQIYSCVAEGVGSGESYESCVAELCAGDPDCKFECEAGKTCDVFEDFDISGCSELTINVGTTKEVNNRLVSQDDVIEQDVSAQGGLPINVNWSGAVLMVTFIFEGADGRYEVLESGGKLAYVHNGAPSSVAANLGSGFVSVGSNFKIDSVPLNAEVMRIRPLGTDAILTLTGLQSPAELLFIANGYCNDVSRSEVVIEPLRPTMPAIFDFVLYSDSIEKNAVSEE